VEEHNDLGAPTRPVAGWLAVSAAAGLIALVALASRSASTPSDGVSIDFSPTFTIIRVIGYVAIALGTVLLPLSFAYSRARARKARADREALLRHHLQPVPWWVRLIGLTVLAGMFALQIAVVLAFIDDLRRQAAGAGAGSPGGLRSIDAGALGQAHDDLTSITIALVVIAIIVVVALYLSIRWRILEQPTGLDGIGRRAALSEAVDVSLEAIRGEPDPRRAVIAAYVAMERSLSRAGMGRHRSEAPLEYLRRVIAAPTGAGDDVRTVTLLFQHARFSQHAVEESMRSRAIDSLGRIRTAIGTSG
jgi:hypothetical protein